MEAVIATDSSGPLCETPGSGNVRASSTRARVRRASRRPPLQRATGLATGRSRRSVLGGARERRPAAATAKRGASSATPIYEKLAVERALQGHEAARACRSRYECMRATRSAAARRRAPARSARGLRLGPRTPRRAPEDAADGVDAKRGHRASRASGLAVRELEALAGSVAGECVPAPTFGAERFAAIEACQALASRAGVGDLSPLSALADPGTSRRGGDTAYEVSR